MDGRWALEEESRDKPLIFKNFSACPIEEGGHPDCRLFPSFAPGLTLSFKRLKHSRLGWCCRLPQHSDLLRLYCAFE